MAWISVMLEVIDDGLLLPLYHCFGSASADDKDNKNEMKNRVKSSLLICCLVYFVFGVSISIATPGLVKVMGQRTELQNDTVPYIRTELCSSVFGSLAKFSYMVLILNNWTTGLYVALVIQMVVSITMDVFLFSQLKISLRLGVRGAAWSSLAASTANLTFLLFYCWRKLQMQFRSDVLGKYDLKWIKVWSKVGVFSAIDSLARNTIYLIVILRAMNVLNEQDSYWIAYSFIWDWLLLPCLPLSEVIKQDIATSGQSQINHWRKMSAYLLISIFILIIWTTTYPLWSLFLLDVLHVHHLEIVNSLLDCLVPCYVFFVIDSLGTAVFYGLGKTHILLAISSIVNAAIVAFFIMATKGVIPFTVYSIALINGGAIVFGSFQTVTAYFFVVRKNCDKL